MRRFLIAIIVAGLALLPAIAGAHGGTEITVRGDARVNGGMEVVGVGFAADDVVHIELRKDGVEPVELGQVAVDANGAFTETLHVPASVMPGIYELAADGQESATAEVTLLEPLTGSTASTTTASTVTDSRPRGETAGLAAFTAAIALASLALLWLSRTHPRAGNA